MSEHIRSGPVSLYLHFPFCERKCRYCDFLSGPAGEETRKEYTKLLCREIELRAHEIKAPAENIAAMDTVFIGGGTPSLMTPAQAARVMDTWAGSTPLQKRGRLFLPRVKPDSTTSIWT